MNKNNHEIFPCALTVRLTENAEVVHVTNLTHEAENIETCDGETSSGVTSLSHLNFLSF